jgi:hypothetical protein
MLLAAAVHANTRTTFRHAISRLFDNRKAYYAALADLLVSLSLSLSLSLSCHDFRSACFISLCLLGIAELSCLLALYWDVLLYSDNTVMLSQIYDHLCPCLGLYHCVSYHCVYMVLLFSCYRMCSHLL